MYTTEEGSSKEQAKFGDSNVTGLPTFTASDAKKTFVTFYDIDNDEWRLFYTANGKNFEILAVCSKLDGFDYYELIKTATSSMSSDAKETETETETETGTDTTEEDE